MEQQLRRLTVLELKSLVRWYNIPGRSRFNKEELIGALINIPEIINNIPEIINNIVGIVNELRNTPMRPRNQPNLPLPIPNIEPPPMRPRNQPNLPPLTIPQPMPGTPPGSPDRFRPGTPPNPPQQNINKPKTKNTKTKQIPFLGNVLNKFWNFVKPYIPKKVKNETEELAKKFIERYKKVNKPQKIKSSPKRDYKKEGARPKILKRNEEKEEEDFTPREFESAINGNYISYRIEGNKKNDEKTFLHKIKPKVIDLIRKRIETQKSLKIKFIFSCRFKKKLFGNIDGIYKYIDASFPSEKSEIVLEGTDLSELFDRLTNQQLVLFEKFLNKESGWEFERVLLFDIFIDRFVPLLGGSYIPLPKELLNRNALINPQNYDEECFKWCVTRAVYPTDKNPQRISKELIEQSKNFNWNGINFPCAIQDVVNFENQNDYDIAIYGYDNKIGVYPIKRSMKRGFKLIRLLLLTEEKTGEEINKHFVLIKNISALIRRQVTKRKCKLYFCDNCLHHFHLKSSLEKHEGYCYLYNEARIDMLKDKDGNPCFISFKNFVKKMRIPFVAYADFECILKQIKNNEPVDKSKSFTNKYQAHKPVAFCCYIKSFNEKICKSKFYRYTAESEEDDVAQKFVEYLEKEFKEIYKNCISYNVKRFKKFNMENMAEDEKINYENATHCHICEKELDKDKVIDHCHLTGKYRGAAHNECNLNYKIPKFFPVIIHNLSGYDAHLFINNLAKTEGKIKLIPNNEEKYISFSKEIVVDTYKDKENGEMKDVKKDIRFIDSLKFMQSSLDKLANNLPKDSFENSKKYNAGDKLELLLRKGVFPYDWLDDIDKLNETQLPPKESFYSKLRDKDISEDDYKHAKKVWETFNMKTMRDYLNLYLQSDVLLLADVFENFRDVCQTNYGLDPAWYYTAPGLAWDAMLKLTKIELEMIIDIDMLIMIDKGVRGGISQISNRYAKANNPYMKEYDPKMVTNYIQYLDANNLYGGAMSKPLPTHGLRWMTKEELTNWKNMPCILEVDLKYPQHLHDLHSDYPLAPERIKVNKVEKLIPNLNDKKNYVIQHETLKRYESLGLEVTDIHRGITFKESAWLKSYIDLNTKLRAQAKNDFEKDFFKLMNNSVFGKTMENLRKRVDIRLVTNEKDARKLISKANYNRRTIFSENLMAIHMNRTHIKYNKPIYLGMCILDISKEIMYDFHYNYIKPKYDEKAKLLMTDTDSLVYDIETEDFYKDISLDVREKFDTSNYPKNHPSGIETGVNKKVIGKFKDETGGKIITEFVGLRAKLYSFRMDDGEEIKKDKGIKKSVIEKGIKFDDYKECLDSKAKQMREIPVIRSYKHFVYTETVNKIALSADDDKRIIQEDGIHTLPYGYYLIKTESGGNCV